MNIVLTVLSMPFIILGLWTDEAFLAFHKEFITPTYLIGTWESKISTKYVFSKIQQKKQGIDSINISIKIYENKMVTGNIGFAILNSCVLMKNRTRIGRALKIKSDYIIIGNLTGGVTDSILNRREYIKLPFSLSGDSLSGYAHFMIEDKSGKGPGVKIMNLLKKSGEQTRS